MDAVEREQVSLILEQEGEKALHATAKLQQELISYHAGKGVLQSGATIKRTVANIEPEASAFVLRAVNRVAPVAQDIDAFALILARLTVNFRHWEKELEDAVSLATGRKPEMNQSAVNAASQLFSEMKVRVTRELEIHRFTFTRPSNGTLQGLGRSIPQSKPVAAEVKRANPGGKPLAQHWDAMWAAIAVKLWNGELDPKTQAELKAAMFDWFNQAGIDVGDTAVTQRARQLWQSMQAEAG